MKQEHENENGNGKSKSIVETKWSTSWREDKLIDKVNTLILLFDKGY